MKRSWLVSGTLLRVLLFNPMSLLKDKAEEISQVCENFDLLLLPGTQQKRKYGLLTYTDHTHNHWCYVFSGTRSSGCCIMLKKSISEESRIFDFDFSRGKAAGRGGSLAVCKGRSHLVPVVAYFPVRPTK